MLCTKLITEKIVLTHYPDFFPILLYLVFCFQTRYGSLLTTYFLADTRSKGTGNGIINICFGSLLSKY